MKNPSFSIKMITHNINPNYKPYQPKILIPLMIWEAFRNYFGSWINLH